MSKSTYFQGSVCNQKQNHDISAESIITDFMKKSIISSITLLTIILACYASFPQNEKTILFNSNIEALADEEGGDGTSYKDFRDKCISGGVTTATASPSGSITILGCGLSLEPNKTYLISYSVWDCDQCKEASCSPKGTVIQSITQL